MGIYVEIPINSSIDELWNRTQTPQLHARWDLRFTNIEYLSRPDESKPQRFLYLTRIGFGLAVRGEGETSGTKPDTSGRRTSALKFWSADWKSLIAEGAGYWQYIPFPDHIRFLTWYDYRTRYGMVGRIIDRLIFRPLLGWATAWSFDRLRLWIEEGIDPQSALRHSIVHALTRLTLASTWLYQGFILGQSGQATWLMSGTAYLASVILLLAWRQRWALIVSLALMLALVISSIIMPDWFAERGAFITWSLTAGVLALIDLVVSGHLPSAGRCKRVRKETRA